MAAHEPRKSTIGCTSPSQRLNHLSSSFASTTSSAFTPSRSLHRPSCSPRINLHDSASRSLSFTLDRPNRSISMTARVEKPAGGPRKSCLCSPTTHPGSFRCSLHKGETALYRSGSSGSLKMRRSAMKNSLVRIGAVEGDWVKRALAALIRPSSHQHRRRGDFKPRPSRLSVMTKADED